MNKPQTYIAIGALALSYMASSCTQQPPEKIEYQPTPDPCLQREYIFDPDCMHKMLPIIERPESIQQEIKTLDSLLTE